MGAPDAELPLQIVDGVRVRVAPWELPDTGEGVGLTVSVNYPRDGAKEVNLDQTPAH